MSEEGEGFKLTQGVVEGATALILILLIVSGSWSGFNQIASIFSPFYPGRIEGTSLIPMSDAGIKYVATGTPGWYAVTNAKFVVKVAVNQLDKMWITSVNQSYIDSIEASLLSGTPYTDIKLNKPIEIVISPLTPTVSWQMRRINDYQICPGATGKYIGSISYDWAGVPIHTEVAKTTTPLFINYIRTTGAGGLTSAILSLPFNVAVKVSGVQEGQSSPTFSQTIDKTYDPRYGPTNSFVIPVESTGITVNYLGVLGSPMQLPSNMEHFIFLPGYVTGDQVNDAYGNPYLIYGGTSSIEPLMDDYGAYWFGGSGGAVVTTGTNRVSVAGLPYEPLGTNAGWRRQKILSHIVNPAVGLLVMNPFGLGNTGIVYSYYPQQPTFQNIGKSGTAINNTWYQTVFGVGTMNYIDNTYDVRPGSGFWEWLKNKSGGTLYKTDTPKYFGGNLLEWHIENSDQYSPNFVANISPTMYTNEITLEIPTTLGNLLVYQTPETITKFEITSPTDLSDLGTIQPGQSYSLTVTVKNTGNAKGTALVYATSLHSAVTVYPVSNQITLEPGTSGTVGFTISSNGVNVEYIGNIVKLVLSVSGSPTILQTLTLKGKLLVPASQVYIVSITLDPPEVPPKGTGSSTAKIKVYSSGGAGTTICTLQVQVTGPFTVSPSGGQFSISPGTEVPWQTVVSATDISGTGWLTANLLTNNQVVSTMSIQIQVKGSPPKDYTMFFFWLLIIGIGLAVVGFYLWMYVGLAFLLFTGLGLFCLSIGGFLFGNAVINAIIQFSDSINMASAALVVRLSAPLWVVAGLSITLGILVGIVVVGAIIAVLALWWEYR